MSIVWRCVALGALATLWACGSDETSSTSAGPTSAGPGTGGAGASGGGSASGGAGGAGGAPGASCEPGTRTGDPAGAENEMTATGTDYNVRVPPTYDPTIGSPLIVVYAPAGADAGLTETFTKLTPDATARGYIIAYADHLVPQTAAQVDDAASIATLIAAKWCVDPARVYLTGHSDGGSTATVVALSEAVQIAAIAPSASGTNGAYLNQQPCPAPLPVMVMHSKNDQLFPGFGAQAAKYWAGCDGCMPDPGAPLADGCVAYTGCTADVEVRYCEGSAQHGIWPGLNASILDFFDRFTYPMM